MQMPRPGRVPFALYLWRTTMFFVRPRPLRQQLRADLNGALIALALLMMFIGVSGLDGTMPFWLGTSLALAGTWLFWNRFHAFLNRR